MKALLLTDYKSLQVADVPEPAIGADDVLVRVRACGICGSDVHGYDGSTGRRIPPIVMGHEAAGVIAAVGSNVTGLREGDRVTFDSMVSCGDCHFCRRGEANLCEARQVLGVSCGDYRRHGAFAEYVAVPRHIVFPLPDSLPFDQAAMVEPTSVAVHAVGLTPVRLGDTGLVVGAGMIGLLTLQALRAAGCGRIIIVDVDDGRLAMARALGADVMLNPKVDNVPTAVADLTGGRGADVALEAVGATEPVKTAIASVRKGGAVTLIGNVTPTVEFPLQSVVTRQIRLTGSCGCCGEYPACIDLLARGAIQVASLISARAPLEEGASWFDRLHGRTTDAMKVVLEP
jgi:L-iditol 2-dehydrogenase